MKLIRLLFAVVESAAMWLVALVLVTAGFAFAQDAAPVVGHTSIPDAYWALISVGIGWLVKEISSPLTSLLKKWFGFEGNTTRLVYIVLTLICTVAYGLVTGAYGQGQAGWISAGGALITALIKGFGDYTKLQQAAASAVDPAQTLPVIGDHLVYPTGTPGTEPLIHNGQVIGAVVPLTPRAGGLEDIK